MFKKNVYIKCSLSDYDAELYNNLQFSLGNALIVSLDFPDYKPLLKKDAIANELIKVKGTGCFSEHKFSTMHCWRHDIMLNCPLTRLA